MERTLASIIYVEDALFGMKANSLGAADELLAMVAVCPDAVGKSPND